MTDSEKLDHILRGVSLIARHIGAVPQAAGHAAAPASGRVASDGDIDGKYGDPKVILDPRDWQGASFKGGRMSECPPDFLELLATILDEFGAKETDPKKQKYKLDDAAKARGWARRKRTQPAETEL